MDNQTNLAIRAAVEAGKAILTIYDNGEELEVQTKDDQSPLTVADQASNAVINTYLLQTGIPVISEENRQIDYIHRKGWGTCWIVDPLDGTKEFIKRNGEFTVNIALCQKGVPVFGVIYVPVTRELYYGDVRLGKSYKNQLDDEHNLSIPLFRATDEIRPALNDASLVRVVGSRSHMSPETEAYIESLKGTYENIEIVSKGSSLKFCLVAEGKADVYPRFAPTMEWDTAAGSAIVEAVGLQVISRETNQPLRYNKENLLNPHFLVRA
jgi:3'(2'), 5'-bisphosphate nucleotidase